MRRHVKASSAGSTSGSGEGHGSIRQFPLPVLLFALALALGISSTATAATTYVAGTPFSFCSGTGTGAGECGELKGVAVDTSNGHVYAVDQGNFRVEEFDEAGNFVKAFGADVNPTGGTGPEVCTTVTTCKIGISNSAVSGTAGAFGTAAKSIAVDPGTHVVYVLTAAARLAFYNGSTGAFIGQTEGTGNQAGSPVPSPPNVNAGAPETFVGGAGIAVDASNPLQHYLYVALQVNSGAKGLIDKFKISASGIEAASYQCQITGTATETKSSAVSATNPTECGGNGNAAHKDGIFEGLDFGNGTGKAQLGNNLAVDASGNVFVAEKIEAEAAGEPRRHYVSEFAGNGNFVTQFKPCCGTPALSTNEPRPEAVATLPNGNLLVADGGPVASSGGTRIQEYNPASAAAPLTEFGSGTIGTAAGGSLGVATDGTNVYVADKTNKKIWKYTTVTGPPPASAPTVSYEPTTAISRKLATLNGAVNPNSAEVSDCHFDYGPDTSYGQSAPCSPAAPGSGTSRVSVSASISGLTPGTTYHFRLVATNAQGTTNGSDQQFTTIAPSKPLVTTTAGATEISQSAAKVAGTVNPNELNVSACKVEYGTSTAYGTTLDCASLPPSCKSAPSGIGAGAAAVGVCVPLTGLSAKTTYHFRFSATNEVGTEVGPDRTFETLPNPPAVITGPATEIGQVTAKANGTVNPNSGNVSACKVEYGTTTAYGSQQPCASLPGSGSSPVDVSASLSGLNAGTTYHYRLVATNPGGTTNGTDQSFFTLPSNLPAATTDGATEGLAETFTMEGHVDPNGIAVTDCHFAYGTDSSEYEKTAPCTPSAAGLGSGDTSIAVGAATEPLEPNTTYHFRLFATNVRGTTQGKDRILITGAAPSDSCANAAIRAEQGIEVMQLPDCLALEQVSPSKKGNQSARNPSALSPDGSRVLFNSAATLGACPNVNGIGGDGFIAIRDDQSGWKIECVTPPVDAEFYNSTGGISFDPGLTSWLQSIRTTSQEVKFFNAGLGTPRKALSPNIENLNGSGGFGFKGASTDHSHVFTSPQGGERDGIFLPGDPVPTGPGRDYNLYVAYRDAGTPSLQLVARDLNGKVWGGHCGARLGGMENTAGFNLNLPNGLRNQGAISADGTRTYFSTRPSQPASGNCTEANKKRIMLREETPAGVEIEELIASECNRVTPDPACSSTDGDDVYQGASVDQKLVYFTTTRQLADADLDSNANSCDRTTAVSGCDLYLYDESKPEGERLTDVSAGESTATTPGIGASVRNSITAISADGSHAYFVARTVLTTDPSPTGAVAQNAQNNLYLYDHGGQDLSFVGTLASGDGGSLFGGQSGWKNGAYAVPIGGTDSEGNEVGGDGHVLLFNSAGQLDPADTDSATDLYRYDADAETLELLSKAVPGGSGNGAFGTLVPALGGSFGTGNEGVPGTDYADEGRWVSEDGTSVTFTTKEALFPGDTNGAEDSYLWRDGQLYHLPGSSRSSASARQILPVVSRDGSTVAYHSTKRLTSSDFDSVEDVYVLRPGGGFSTPTTAVCQGEACQGSPSTLGDDIGATTGSGSSAGNAAPTAAKCPKGKRKVRRNGKPRCVKPAKHKKKSANKQKRTSSKQGGQK